MLVFGFTFLLAISAHLIAADGEFCWRISGVSIIGSVLTFQERRGK